MSGDDREALLVGAQDGVELALGREAGSPVVGGLGKFSTQALVVSRLVQRMCEGDRVARVGEEGGTGPQFTEGRDVGKNEGAAMQGGLEHSQAERFVERG